jgi:hydrogenase maturation factor
MSEAIKGSKTTKYIKELVPNVEGSDDRIEHLSIQTLWDSRGANDTLIHGIYRDSAIAKQIEVGSVKRKIKITGHNAKIGDFLLLDNGNAEGEEVPIIKIIDADYFIIAKEINAAIGDDAFILKPVTPQYAKDGSLAVSQGPVQYRNSVTSLPEEVTMDTVTTANIKALPTELIFKKDGVNTRVSYDTTTPSNSEAIPVNIVTVDGTGIETTVNLSGAQINVQLSHNGTSPDSVQIGDGTSLAQVYDDTVNRHLRTHDKITFDELSLMNDKFVTGTIIGDVNLRAGTNIIGKVGIDQTTDGVTNAIYIKNIDPALKDRQADVDSLSVSLSDENVALLGDTSEVAPVTDIAASGLNGRLQRIAQRISSLIDLFPTTIGQQVEADSISVTLASDHQNVNTVEMSADGVTPLASQAINRTAQKAISTIGADFLTKAVTSITMGFDGDEHREILLTSTGKTEINASQLPTSLGSQVSASSLSIAPASDAVFKTVETSQTSGTITSIQKSVGTSAVRATVSGSAPSARKKLLLKPSKNNTGAIYLGSSSVTTADGLEIIGPDRLEFLNENNDYYLISDTAGQVVEILEVY